MRASKMVKEVATSQQKSELIVTPRFMEFMLKHDDGVVFSEPTQKILTKVMTTKPRVRVNSFSASSSGGCDRQQVLSYLGMPVLGAFTPTQRLIFLVGSFFHVMAQGVCLDAGIIHDIEVPLKWPRHFVKGSMDGVGIVPSDHPVEKYRDQDFILEVKSANEYSFQDSVQRLGRPSDGYLAQGAKYMLLSGIDIIVYFYISKDKQQVHEWVYHRDDLKTLIRDSEAQAIRLGDSVRAKKLPPRLKGAERGINPECRQCPFGTSEGACMKVEDWP